MPSATLLTSRVSSFRCKQCRNVGVVVHSVIHLCYSLLGGPELVLQLFALGRIGSWRRWSRRGRVLMLDARRFRNEYLSQGSSMWPLQSHVPCSSRITVHLFPCPPTPPGSHQNTCSHPAGTCGDEHRSATYTVDTFKSLNTDSTPSNFRTQCVT